jgi:ABC-type multidrug transport system ATPase subunit
MQNISYKSSDAIIYKVTIYLKNNGLYFVKGKNGSGKSTFFKALNGEVRSQSCEIFLDNIKIFPYKTNEIIFIDDQFIGYEYLKIHEYLIYILNIYKKGIMFDLIEALISELEIKEYQHKLIKDLSQGNKQKLAFAASILIDSSVMLFDEMFEHIDTLVLIKIKKIISSLSHNHFIFFTSHSEIMSDLTVNTINVQEGKILFDKEDGRKKILN